MNPRRLFIASCIALITSAFSFMIRQDIADPLAADFSLTKQAIGEVMGAAFLGMAVAMLLVAPLCDFLGMGRVIMLAWICHLAGILGTIFAPKPPAVSADTSYWVLWCSTFLVGSGNGLVEIAINPLAATLYPRNKTHYLNILHAWWPGGLIMSGLLAIFVINPALGLTGESVSSADSSMGWKVKMGLLLVPLVIYGLLSLGQRFPVTERVQANVSTGEMFLQVLRPMFLLWAFCMLLTASTELGPNQWQESVLKRTAFEGTEAGYKWLGVFSQKGFGTLVFVYTSGLMFVMRFFAGPLAHRFSPVGMLTGSALFSALGLYWLSYVNTPFMAFVAATVFGVGIAYFWPTMLGVTAERFPKGGALLLGLMGSFGNLAISQALPVMGGIYDSYTVANISPELRAKKVTAADGSQIPVVTPDTGTWLPRLVAENIYPTGTQKLNPDAVKLLSGTDLQEVQKAETVGAAHAFRWVAVLPSILVIIFGLIALTDKLRGGYRAVHISEGMEEEATPL
jgi:MFS family permease